MSNLNNLNYSGEIRPASDKLILGYLFIFFTIDCRNKVQLVLKDDDNDVSIQ